MRVERRDIFKAAVLVLSKCDTIREGNEDTVMEIIEKTSPEIQDFPYE